MGINWEVLAQVKQTRIKESLEQNHHAGSNPKIIGGIITEESEDIVYIYFESRCDGFTKGMVRYHQLIYSGLYFTKYYEESNVIGEGNPYTIDQLKSKFRNYLIALLRLVDKVN